MKNIIFILLSIIILISFISCIEHTEEIIISEDGTTTITSNYKGKVSEIEELALPCEPVWTVTKIMGDGIITDSSQMELRAETTIPYGDKIPSTYAKPDDDLKDIQLQFPTEVKFWTEGNRTYYEFKRTYQARKFQCFDLPTLFSHLDIWDQDLENRILEKGIFNVSENDRDKYLDQMICAYAYLHWRLHWETISEMYAGDFITLEQKTNMEKQTADYLENTLTKVRVLGILGKEEDSIGVELNRLTKSIHKQYYTDFVKAVGEEKTKLHQKFTSIFDKTKLDYEITKKLDSHSFAVAVELPGIIIKTNGFIEFEKPNVVKWAFKGDGLHDKNIPLYVLSVVEK